MPRSHTHHASGRTCRFATLRECDENVTQFQHGHLGHPCVKDFQPSKSKRGQMNKTATCTIIDLPEAGRSFEQSLADQMARAPQAYRDDVAAFQAAQEVQ